MTMQTITRWLMLFVTLTFSNGVHAQISVGVKAGLNLNQFQQPGTTVGSSFGAFAGYQPLTFLALKFEPQYSAEGGGRPTYSKSYSDISANVASITFINPSVRMHNLQLPLLIELWLPEHANEVVKPKIILGASYALAVASIQSHTERFELLDNSSSPYSHQYLDISYRKDNVTDNYKRNQWSLWCGVGIDFKVGTRVCTFDVRYRKGINNLNLLRFASSMDQYSSSSYSGIPGTGGKLYSSSVSMNFSISLFNF